MTYRVMQLHNGAVTFDSQPGEGTTFRFSLLTDYEKGDTVSPFAMRPTTTRTS